MESNLKPALKERFWPHDILYHFKKNRQKTYHSLLIGECLSLNVLVIVFISQMCNLNSRFDLIAGKLTLTQAIHYSLTVLIL